MPVTALFIFPFILLFFFGVQEISLHGLSAP